MEYTVTTERIAVTREAYFYLENKGRVQRGFKVLKPESEEHLWYGFEKFGIKDLEMTESGLKILDYDSLGGADEQGRRTTWTVDEMRKMLKEAGYEWEELEAKTYKYQTIDFPL